MTVRRPAGRDHFPAENVARDEKYVLNYDSGALMIRVEQVRGWVETQAERLRPRAALLLARLRVLAARALRDSQGRRLRASAYALGPEGIKHGRRRARAGTPRLAGSLLPAAAKIGLVVLVAGFGFLASSSVYINYAADLPDAHQITSNPLPEDTMIYASDGTTLLADVHKPDDPQHYYESLDQMGKWLPDATIAIEDSGFWTEPGI